MKFHQIFLASLYEPKKLAAFRLLSIGKVFSYIFIFVTIFTLISFVRFSTEDVALFENAPDLLEHAQTIGWLIYPIAFLLQLVISVFYIFIRISIFAYIGVFILNMRKKRFDYLQIWRTTAIAMTVPIIFTIGFDFFYIAESISLLISSIIHFTYIFLATKYYPNQPIQA